MSQPTYTVAQLVAQIQKKLKEFREAKEAKK
jgi:hypothetical protein